MQEDYRHASASSDDSALSSLSPSLRPSTLSISDMNGYVADSVADSAHFGIASEHDKGRWMYWSGEMSGGSGPLSPGHAKSSRPDQRRRR